MNNPRPPGGGDGTMRMTAAHGIISCLALLAPRAGAFTLLHHTCRGARRRGAEQVRRAIAVRLCHLGRPAGEMWPCDTPGKF